MAINRIDSTPVRISSALPTSTQSTGSGSFAGKVNVGGSFSGGITAPFTPGGAIVSAAVSSHATGNRGGAVSSQYQSNTSPLSQMQADLDAAAAANQKLAAAQQGGGSGAVSYAPGTGGGTAAQMQSDLLTAQAENGRLLRIQMEMQRPGTSMISNILKIRHDTVKNTIQNVR